MPAPRVVLISSVKKKINLLYIRRFVHKKSLHLRQFTYIFSAMAKKIRPVYHALLRRRAAAAAAAAAAAPSAAPAAAGAASAAAAAPAAGSAGSDAHKKSKSSNPKK